MKFLKLSSKKGDKKMMYFKMNKKAVGESNIDILHIKMMHF